MLYDDVIAGTYREKIAEGYKRFAIDNSIVKLYRENFHKNAEFINNLRHVVKLPYPKVWFEVNYGGGAKIGFLVHQQPDGFLSISGVTKHEEFPTIRCCPSEIYANEKNLMIIKSYIAEDNVNFMEKERNSKFLGSILSDLIGIIGVINSPKIIQIDNVESERGAKTKAGQKRLHSYSIIRIKAEMIKKLRESENIAKEQKLGRKLHWRRGHFKHCRTGTFWWSAHLAGSAVNGVVKSSYAVEA